MADDRLINLAAQARKHFPDYEVILNEVQTSDVAHNTEIVGIYASENESMGLALYDKSNFEKLDYVESIFCNEADVERAELIVLRIDENIAFISTDMDSCVQPVSIKNRQFVIDFDLRHDVAGLDNVASIVSIKSLGLTDTGRLVINAENATEHIEEIFMIKDDRLGDLCSRKVTTLSGGSEMGALNDQEYYTSSDYSFAEGQHEDDEVKDEEGEEKDNSFSESEEEEQSYRGKLLDTNYQAQKPLTSPKDSIANTINSEGPSREAPKAFLWGRQDEVGTDNKPATPKTLAPLKVDLFKTNEPKIAATSPQQIDKAPAADDKTETAAERRVVVPPPKEISEACLDIVRAMDSRINYMKNTLKRLNTPQINAALGDSCGIWEENASLIEERAGASNIAFKTDSHDQDMMAIDSELNAQHRNLRSDLQILDILLNARKCGDVESSLVLVNYIVKSLGQAAQPTPYLKTWMAARDMLIAVKNVQTRSRALGFKART